METRVHISLEVSDLEKSMDFYSKLFGQAPTKVQTDYANFRLESPQLHLALVHKPNRKPELGTDGGSNRHYGIELFSGDRLEAWLKDVQKAGLQTRTEEDITCCYATADKFWTRDPDGHEWEFWVRLGEANAMHSQSLEKGSEKVCCAPGQC